MSQLINQEVAEFIGNNLQVSDGDFDLPFDLVLPETFRLNSVWLRRRGALVGRNWYLQSDRGDLPQIDLVSVDCQDGEGSQSVCLEFLKHHGYREIDILTFSR